VVPVIDQALTEAGVTLQDIDGGGVTHGPGLVGALLVGVAAAKALAFAAGIPLLGVHHLEGHIFAALLTHPETGTAICFPGRVRWPHVAGACPGLFRVRVVGTDP